MLAEKVGEYGYPERRADAVSDEAIQWLGAVPAGDPFFLWVHFYDPHAPYQPPEGFGGGSEMENYLGEVAFADREMGRILDAVRARSKRVVVAVVGDHGEALGDHGERTHGIFVYTSTIEVPMVIAGPGVPEGLVVDEPAAVRRLAATLLGLVGKGEATALPGPALPGFVSAGTEAEPAYSEAMMPAAVYGWSPLHAVTWDRWRYIDAPRPELYDLSADPEEQVNLVDAKPADAAQLATMLEELLQRPGRGDGRAPDLDPETRAALRALGYAEGGSGEVNDGIDPKDGIKLLDEFERAKALLAAGEADKAAAGLDRLVEKNPSNLPFHNRLAEAQLAAGQGDASVATLGRALDLAPNSSFVNLALANTLFRLGRLEQAEQAYRKTVAIDPRSAPAWLGLAALAGEPKDELVVLTNARDAGVESLLVVLRAAQLERAAGHLEASGELLDRAETMAPNMAAVQLERARLLQQQGRLDEALDACRQAAEIEPANPHTALCTGRIYLAMDQPTRAKPHLLRAAVLGKGTSVEEEARKLIDSIND
jgi:Flp pilus assembly protein TadD